MYVVTDMDMVTDMNMDMDTNTDTVLGVDIENFAIFCAITIL
jgi:hypothetical protein